MCQCPSRCASHDNRVIAKHWLRNQSERELGNILKRSHIFPFKNPIVLRILENKEQKQRSYKSIILSFFIWVLPVVMGSKESSTGETRWRVGHSCPRRLPPTSLTSLLLSFYWIFTGWQLLSSNLLGPGDTKIQKTLPSLWMLLVLSKNQEVGLHGLGAFHDLQLCHFKYELSFKQRGGDVNSVKCLLCAGRMAQC